jgi:hypothetical protein
LRRFTRRHGWRAYALPVLVVVTIAALTTVDSDHRSSSLSAKASPTTRSATTRSTTGPVTTTASALAPAPTSQVKVEAGGNAEDLADSALPPGAPYTVKGKGTFRVIPGSSSVVGTGPVKKYVIEVENGITGVNLDYFAAFVVATLSDKRSWTGNGVVSLERVSSDASADFRVSLTSALTVRTLCGYDQKIETSCWENQLPDGTPTVSRVNLDVARWVRGDTQFGQDLNAYHGYMVNHEVGHALGHVHTYTCLPGGLAPVMMQQTITLKENQGAGPKICQPNIWPYPAGVDPRVAVPT